MSSFAINIVIISILDLGAILCAKFYNIGKNPFLLMGTIVLFGAAGYVFAKSLKYEGMAITNILWMAFSAIIVTVIGYFLFKEAITPIQMVGILVIIIGLALINFK